MKTTIDCKSANPNTHRKHNSQQATKFSCARSSSAHKTQGEPQEEKQKRLLN